MLFDQLPVNLVQDVRRNVYLGPGYHVLRGYLSPQRVEYIVDHWRRLGNAVTVRKVNKARLFHVNCPDYTYADGQKSVHHNFFWNVPSDPLTYEVAWRIQRLRNQIQGTHASDSYFAVQPYDWTDHLAEGRPRRAVSYRLVGTRNDGGVSLHRDWVQDPSKVQMSLSLSATGADYTAGGLLFRTREGALLNLCETERLQPGDLVVFRYCHEHGVGPVSTSAGQRGFWRLLFPIEALTVPASAAGVVRGALARLVRQGLNRVRGSVRAAAPSAASTLEDPELRALAEIAIQAGCAPTEVFHPKGLFARWHSMQDWQLAALKHLGLRPEHRLLDVGCGVLRLGLAVIPYLESGKYFGTDPMDVYVATARRYLLDVLRTEKVCHLRVDRDFAFAAFGAQFEFAVAHSVFTHMTFDEIRRCLRALAPHMAPGGRLLFTVALDRRFGRDFEESFLYNADTPMVRSYHASLALFEALRPDLGFRLERFDAVPHPSQTAFVATFQPTS